MNKNYETIKNSNQGRVAIIKLNPYLEIDLELLGK